MQRSASEPSAGPPELRSHSGLRSERAEVEAWWMTHRRWLAAVLLAHMPREADLEDLLQEVALVVKRSLARQDIENMRLSSLQHVALLPHDPPVEQVESSEHARLQDNVDESSRRPVHPAKHGFHAERNQ